MKTKLKDYLDARDELRDFESAHRPVITISREFGCEATPIAEGLIEKLNTLHTKQNDWQIISKEILEDVSNELNVTPVRIEHAMENAS